jgi:hypothetical protein
MAEEREKMKGEVRRLRPSTFKQHLSLYLLPSLRYLTSNLNGDPI